MTNQATTTTRFTVGQSYSCRSIGDHQCVWSYTVTKRTEKTVTIRDEQGTIKVCRPFIYDGVECIKPLGSYSMAPTLRA